MTQDQPEPENGGEEAKEEMKRAVKRAAERIQRIIRESWETDQDSQNEKES